MTVQEEALVEAQQVQMVPMDQEVLQGADQVALKEELEAMATTTVEMVETEAVASASQVLMVNRATVRPQQTGNHKDVPTDQLGSQPWT